jgi:aminopeptidase N
MYLLAKRILLLTLAFVALQACQHYRDRPNDRVLNVLENTLTLTPDFELKKISVIQVTSFTTGNAGPAEIIFSPNNLEIENATIDGEAATFVTTSAGVVFTSAKLVQPDQVLKLIVSYRVGENRGVSFNETGILTTYFACDWMLCHQDKPSDRSTLSVKIVLPKGENVVSVGRQMSIESLPSGQELHVWRSRLPFSPYLFGFVTGQFETQVIQHRGRELAYVNATGQAQPMQRLFGTTPAMIDFFVEKAGMPLPTQRYTQVLVTGGNAQEHTTYSIIGTTNLNPILTDPKDDWVIAHELAHQWWGNSVTSASWQHFWLNEGITVFMTAAWKEHRHGRAAYDRELGIARSRWQRAKDAGWDRSLTFAGEYPTLSIRRAIQYSKGALFMDQLRSTLGEEVFWRGLRNYTQANAGRAVVSKDFQFAMERASRRDLSVIFDEWVYD